MCGQAYCSECVRATGRCDTCAVIEKHGGPAHFQGEGWAVDPEVARLLPHYRWLQLSNERYTVYWWEGSAFRAAVLVVQHTSRPARLVHFRRISMVERMRGLLGG